MMPNVQHATMTPHATSRCLGNGTRNLVFFVTHDTCATPPGQKSESKAASVITERCASIPMVIKFLIEAELADILTCWRDKKAKNHTAPSIALRKSLAVLNHPRTEQKHWLKDLIVTVRKLHDHGYTMLANTSAKRCTFYTHSLSKLSNPWRKLILTEKLCSNLHHFSKQHWFKPCMWRIFFDSAST